MAILLTWSSSNEGATVIKIYRDSKPLEVGNLPEPIITLPGDAKQYIDNSAAGAATHHYLIEVTDGNERVFTRTPSVINLRTRGPGSPMLLQGDLDCGYYGTVKASELPPLSQAYGIPPHIEFNINYAPTEYYKFAWKGRVLYIANTPAGGNDFMYDRNKVARYLRSGLKYNFESPAISGVIENIHEANGFKFHARAPRMTPEDWDGVLPCSHQDVIKNPDTEFNQLLGAIMHNVPAMKLKLHGIPVMRTLYYSASAMIVADPGDSKAAINDYPSLRFINSSTNGINSTYLGATVFGPGQADGDSAANAWFSAHPGSSSSRNRAAYFIPVFELIED